ncbi:hypothetical protein Snoj_11560 [Streptomyces nojiriensis]|uniref:Uncharacterized protein n=1 Tax=Streptomyces nojiriensis TaxID=66374 RepID=A0ABQ3SGG5_9ACTN|nr:hypothetical protein GCM10010205_41380 [Streptomyces nojiriensis]GHI67238.1 hypothetical protein Snoj_11560 [Streptomyces nojiriensis]
MDHQADDAEAHQLPEPLVPQERKRVTRASGNNIISKTIAMGPPSVPGAGPGTPCHPAPPRSSRSN